MVGADGIRSTLRTQVLSKIPTKQPILQYIQIFLILGISHLDHPLLTQRGFYTLDGAQRLFIMPFEDEDDADGSAFGENTYETKGRKTMWQLSFYLENEKEAMNLSKCDQHTLLNEVKKRVLNWHSPVFEMVENTDIGSVWGT